MERSKPNKLELLVTKTTQTENFIARKLSLTSLIVLIVSFEPGVPILRHVLIVSPSSLMETDNATCTLSPNCKVCH
jgi:hypothetical protein